MTPAQGMAATYETTAVIAYVCAADAGSEPGNGYGWLRAHAQVASDCIVVTREADGDKLQADRVLEEVSNVRVVSIPDSLWLRTLLPHRLWLYVNYIAFLRKASRAVRRIPSVSLVHHVTWGTLNFGTVDPAQAHLLWGPVGGGQTTPSFLRPLFHSEWSWERLRNGLSKLLQASPLVRRGVHRSSLVFATNEDTASIVRSVPGGRVHLLLADAIEGVVPARIPSAEAEVLWVGRMLPRKGALTAVRIFAELVKLLPSARLTMVGDGPEFGAAVELCEELGLGNLVYFTGRVRRSEVEQFYAKSSLFLFTSLRDSFGGQILEAASHSLPLILFDHQSAKALLEDARCACVVPTLPTETLSTRAAQAICGVLTDPVRRETMARAAHQFASENTWSHRAELLAQLATSELNL